jgi:riboflavin transporter
MKRNQSYIRYITFLAAFSALAYLSTFITIKMFSFLSYEPKDVIITIGGMIFGPIFAILISVLVPFFEMITTSSTGIIGFVMNLVAAICFVIPPVMAYSRKKKFSSLVIGLILGVLLQTLSMLLWNYLLSPIFFGYPRSEVVKMLIPIIMPFNLVKGGLNSIFVIFLYRPIMNGLIKSNVLKTTDFNMIDKENKWTNYAVIFLIVTTIVLIVMASLKVI